MTTAAPRILEILRTEYDRIIRDHANGDSLKIGHDYKIFNENSRDVRNYNLNQADEDDINEIIDITGPLIPNNTPAEHFNALKRQLRITKKALHDNSVPDPDQLLQYIRQYSDTVPDIYPDGNYAYVVTNSIIYMIIKIYSVVRAIDIFADMYGTDCLNNPDFCDDIKNDPTSRSCFMIIAFVMLRLVLNNNTYCANYGVAMPEYRTDSAFQRVWTRCIVALAALIPTNLWTRVALVSAYCITHKFKDLSHVQFIPNNKEGRVELGAGNCSAYGNILIPSMVIGPYASERCTNEEYLFYALMHKINEVQHFIPNLQQRITDAYEENVTVLYHIFIPLLLAKSKMIYSVVNKYHAPIHTAINIRIQDVPMNIVLNRWQLASIQPYDRNNANPNPQFDPMRMYMLYQSQLDIAYDVESYLSGKARAEIYLRQQEHVLDNTIDMRSKLFRLVSGAIVFIINADMSVTDVDIHAVTILWAQRNGSRLYSPFIYDINYPKSIFTPKQYFFLKNNDGTKITICAIDQIRLIEPMSVDNQMCTLISPFKRYTDFDKSIWKECPRFNPLNNLITDVRGMIELANDTSKEFVVALPQAVLDIDNIGKTQRTVGGVMINKRFIIGMIIIVLLLIGVIVLGIIISVNRNKQESGDDAENMDGFTEDTRT